VILLSPAHLETSPPSGPGPSLEVGADLGEAASLLREADVTLRGVSNGRASAGR
jgi:hypothetical protein